MTYNYIILVTLMTVLFKNGLTRTNVFLKITYSEQLLVAPITMLYI